MKRYTQEDLDRAVEEAAQSLPKREWKGTWIPMEIWESKQITWMQKCLWAEVFNLHDPKEGGCWASNAFLAKRMESSVSSIANMLSALRAVGLLRTVQYDNKTGRRVILAVAPYHNTPSLGGEGGIHSAVNHRYQKRATAKKPSKASEDAVALKASKEDLQAFQIAIDQTERRSALGRKFDYEEKGWIF